MRVSRICFLACALLSSQGISAKDSQAFEPPNILFVMADDLGFGDLGVYGQSKINTPNIDQLASKGIKFTQHYAGATVCGPSRASLLTGLHAGHSPIRGNPKWTTSGQPVEFSSKHISLGKVMQQAGYQTALIGKWGMADGKQMNLDAMPNQNGFDFFYGYKTHLAAHHYYWHQMYRNNEMELVPGNQPETNQGIYTHDLFTHEALAYLDRVEDSSPFFMMLSYTIPHKAITVPDDSKQAYMKLGWPQRPLKTDGHYKNDAEGNVSYAGMVSRLDRDVGKLIEKLKQQGRYENTLVIFTSDNGHEYDNGFFDSSGGLRGKKRDLYEGGIRVPLLVHWPEQISQPKTSDRAFAFWDHLITFCQLSKTPDCPKTDGVSYLPSLLGKDEHQREHEYLYWEFNEAKGPMQALRVGKFKLLNLYRKPLELYDVEADPFEQTNLTTAYPEVAKSMLQRLKTVRTFHPEFQLKPLPNPWKKKSG